MERKSWRIVLSVSVLFIALALLGGEAYAQSVCYQWSIFSAERIRINIQPQGVLSTGRESTQFKHANQSVFDVSGKEVGGCGAGTMATVNGSIVVGKSKNPDTPKGAHLGLHGFFVRGTDTESCWPIQWDCTSEETRPDPETWNCISRNDAPVFHGASTLTKVNPKTDPLCSIFEDGAIITLTGEGTQTVGSAMKP